MWRFGPHLIGLHGSWDHPSPNPNGISIGSAVFAQLTSHRGAHSPLKIAPTLGKIWTPSNTWFLGPIRVLNPNGISIGSTLFCRAHYCDRPTDRPTDHAIRSVIIGRIYVRSTAMRPSNTPCLENLLITSLSASFHN